MKKVIIIISVVIKWFFFCLCGYSGGRWIRLVLLSCMMRIRLLLVFSCVIFFISRVSISMWRRLWISWLSYIWMVRFVFVLIWFGFLRMYVMLFVVLYGCIFVFWNIFLGVLLCILGIVKEIYNKLIFIM